MKQYIDSLFYNIKFEKNATAQDKIAVIEDTYNEAVKYVIDNAIDEYQIKSYCDYAHILYSKKVLSVVDLDDYVEYIQRQEQIKRINNEVTALRNPAEGYVRKLTNKKETN